MAVVNVSRKKSRALMVLSPGLTATDQRRAVGEQDSGPVRCRVGVRHRATDRAPIADLRVTDDAGDVMEERISVADDVSFVDLPMGGAGADAQCVVAFGDRIEAADRLEVDEQAGLCEPELDQRKKAVAAGQQLGLPFTVLEDLQDVVQASRANVVELAWDHRAGPSSPLMAGPIAAHHDTADQSCREDVGPSIEPRPRLDRCPRGVAEQYPSPVVAASTLAAGAVRGRDGAPATLLRRRPR